MGVGTSRSNRTGLTGWFDLVDRAGMLDPRRIPSLTTAITRWGPTVAAPYAATAFAKPHAIALIDDHGSVTFSDLERRSTASAKGLQSIGVRRGQRIGLACLNHRDFVELTLAAAKAGLGVVYLNTSFAAPQMAEVVKREDISVLAVDAALLPVTDLVTSDVEIIVTDTDGTHDDEHDPQRGRALADLRSAGTWRLPLRASLPVAPVLLTSGTTGTPKGAQRSNRVAPSSATGVVELIPYRHDDVIAITSPLFHAWGLAQMVLASTIGATVSVMSTFDPVETLARIERDQVTVLAVVPAILQRLLASPALDDTDLSSLRVVASSGSALPVPVVEEWLDRVGPNLYNLYGSTEVGQATLATPSDLLAEPSTAGRVMPGSVVAILDDDDREVPAGTVGRIFVGNGAQFEQYTGGGGKQVVDGLMSSGDVGRMTSDGLLFVTGRADDMIVSGGENVFPREVEDLVLTHPKIVDVAVVGVDDDEFGQRLAVYAVKAPGARVSAAAIKNMVAANLARHKTPRDVHFVGELPRTATGKIRRGLLT